MCPEDVEAFMRLALLLLSFAVYTDCKYTCILYFFRRLVLSVSRVESNLIRRSRRPQIDAPAAVLREKRGSLVSAVARELEPAFRAHARHLR